MQTAAPSAHVLSGLRALREPVLTLLAMLGTVACAQAVDPGVDAAVLAAVLALSLARSHLAGDRRGVLEAVVTLPLVSLASVGVGALLRQTPWLGAAVFVAGMASSVAMRRFGPLARRVGRLLALPLVTLLAVPHLPHRAATGWRAVAVPMAIAVLALAWVLLARAAARLLGWRAPRMASEPASERAPAASTVRPSPPLRMALQMATALAAAFAVGYLAFPAHWSWVVLTALLVNLGNRGRLDVAHKSVLRVLGAAGGTVVAMAVQPQPGGGGAAAAALVLACVFVGLCLRPLGYGWWALCVTLALALLPSLAPAAAPLLLGQRLGEIAVGAVIGVASACLVLPVRSTDVLRRRIADALAVMSSSLDPQVADRHAAQVAAALREVTVLRPSFHAHRLALRRWQALQPADWIDAIAACEAPVVALVERGASPGAVRKAIGAARQAMREPAAIAPALAALRRTLEESGAVRAEARHEP